MLLSEDIKKKNCSTNVRPSVFMLVTETTGSGNQHFGKMLCVGYGMCYGSHYIICENGRPHGGVYFDWITILTHKYYFCCINTECNF